MKGFALGIIVGLILGVVVSSTIGELNLFTPGVVASDPINPKKGSRLISIKDTVAAYKLIKNHRNRNNSESGRRKYGRSHYFTKTFLRDTMLISDAVGLNFYPGLRTQGDNEAFLLVVGVDEKGHDLLPKKDSFKSLSYPIGITDMKCPNNCDNDSRFNTYDD